MNAIAVIRRIIPGLFFLTGLAAQVAVPGALELVRAVVNNQKAVNLVYDAEAVITFFNMEDRQTSQRIVRSRYDVVAGRIIRGKRLSSREDTGDLSPDRIPAYQESRILPLFSPLSDEALTRYQFEYRGSAEYKGQSCWLIAYQPLEPDEQFSQGLIRISRADTDLVALEMRAVKDFTFTEDFKMAMEYDRIDGLWVPQHIRTDLIIQILGLYKRRVVFDQRVIARHF